MVKSIALPTGVTLQYAERGSATGVPVIFLHGWVGSWRYWITSMQVASTSFRAYALDLWGFGDTAHNVLNYSIEQQVSLIDRFLMEMGIGKIALVGHGLGALVGMSFATRSRPRRATRASAGRPSIIISSGEG